MHRSWSAAVLVASLWLAPAMPTSADSQDALDQARALLQKNDGQGAAVLLEEALAGEPSQREEILDLLRRAYERAAEQAEAAGDRAGAETFRDNLEILNHKPRSKSQSEPKPKLDGGNELAPTDPAIAKAAAPSPVPTSPASLATPEALPNSSTAALPSASTPSPTLTPLEEMPPEVVPPATASASDSTSPSQVSDSPTSAPLQTPVSAPAPSAPIAAPPQTQAPAPKTPEVSLVAADAAFTSKRYAEACRLYMGLAQVGKLPASRRDHLAYCRCAEVVRRINARPSSAAEWKSIDTEIQQIRKMSPNNWYAEYLRNLASERSPASRNRPSQKVVVRGSAPEERPVDGLRLPAGTPVLPTPKTPAPLEPASNPAPAAEPASAPAPVPTPASAPGDPGPTVVSQWQVRETANFRILHTDPDLAEQVAEVVESTREEQVKRWNGSTGRGAWTPRCDVYVYPTRTTFSRMTGQNPESPGFSTMGMNGGRIVNRRINVRADHPNLVAAILPHEVTHVVLADLFPQKQIPRWADEGMAVLSEPTSEQQLRAQDLEKPLSSGQLFKLHELMVMDYPDGKFWSLYYAQSVSLTRFLVEQGSPAQFVKFVQGTQRNGYEAELKRIYQIDGFDDLEERWLAYARTKSADLAAARLGKAPDTANR